MMPGSSGWSGVSGLPVPDSPPVEPEGSVVSVPVPGVSVVAGMHLGMWFLIVLELIYCAVFYFLTVYFLQKHLNLE